MFSKNNRISINKLCVNFIASLVYSTLIFAVFITVLNIQINFLSQNFVYNLELIIALLAVYLWFSKAKNRTKKTARIVQEVSKSLFFMVLIFIVILNIYLGFNLFYFNNIEFILIPAAIILGYIILLSNIGFEKSEEIIKNKEDESRQEKLNNFSNKFPKINRYPLVRSLVRWCQKEGVLYVLALVMISGIFTAIKAPYFGYNFAGRNQMKYSSFVEPAKYMLAHQNPFWYQLKYYTDIFIRPNGILKKFNYIPLNEWGLFATFRLLPFNSTEFNTRIFTNLLELVAFYLSYILLTKWFTKIQSLIITLLFVLNPVFNFTFFVTVEDSWLIIFSLLNLIYLNNYLNKSKNSDLFISGLFLGIGGCTKFSIFFWQLPIIFIILITKNKQTSYIFKSLFILGALAVLPMIAFRTSLTYLPTNALFAILAFIVWFCFFRFIYLYISKNDHKIKAFFDKITKNKVILFNFLSLITVLLIAFIYFTQLYVYAAEFLTDFKLIFNWKLYQYMLNKEFKYYMTDMVFNVGIIGFIYALFHGSRKIRTIVFSFVAGSLFYWLAASKVIFFHTYYTGIIMITFCLSAGIFIYTIAKSLSNKFLSISTVLLFFVLMVPSLYYMNVSFLSKQGDTYALNETADYLSQNTGNDDVFLDGSSTPILSLTTDRSRIELDILVEQKDFKDLIKDIGFSKTMNKYNIKYLITDQNGPVYIDFANLFTDEALQSVSYRRSDLIRLQLGQIDNYFSDIELRNEIVDKYSIRDKFVLEKDFGSYRIYTFSN